MVDVGQGLTEEDYEGRDVTGKAVLVSGAGWGYRAAVYLYANPDWPARLQGVICCDMVGENQQLCGGHLVLERTPDTLPSYLNDLGERFLNG